MPGDLTFTGPGLIGATAGFDSADTVQTVQIQGRPHCRHGAVDLTVGTVQWFCISESEAAATLHVRLVSKLQNAQLTTPSQGMKCAPKNLGFLSR